MLKDKTQDTVHVIVTRTIGFSRPIHYHRHYNERTQLLFMTIHSVNPFSLRPLPPLSTLPRVTWSFPYKSA